MLMASFLAGMDRFARMGGHCKLPAVTLGLLFRISYRIVHDNIDESEVMITHTASL